MKWGFRWYGEKGDTIPLKHVRQIPGINGVVGTSIDQDCLEMYGKFLKFKN